MSEDKSIPIKLRGYDLVRDPLLNKGSAFSSEERQALGLCGILPIQTNTIEQQVVRIHQALQKKTTPLERYIGLASLQERNETLFYKLLSEHVEDYMPIIYTPTVGAATQNFSHMFRRGRGVWLTPDHRGRMKEVLKAAAESRDIKMLVVTDNESILGIGDQGAGGMAISIGKLALYTVGAGIHPGQTLPVSLDVGTDNESLLKDSLYLGWPKRRLRGDDYYALIEEFVDAVKALFPEALLQWEDLRKDNAQKVLADHRERILSFNDDIQGTGAVAFAGLLSAIRVSGVPLQDHRVVVFGGGAAGQGVSQQLRSALREHGLSETEIFSRVAVLDRSGLIVDDLPIEEEYKKRAAWPAEVALKMGLAPDQRDLASVVEKMKPTVLMGASGVPGAFTKALVQSVHQNISRPVIMPFSNPTDYAEAAPKDIIEWTDGQALIATGSPFEAVDYKGKRFEIGQGNNVFIFPGLGLGSILVGATRVSDGMINAAAAALAESVKQSDLDKGMMYPHVSRLREVTLSVTQAVANKAIEEGLATRATEPLTAEYIKTQMWQPKYLPYHAA